MAPTDFAVLLFQVKVEEQQSNRKNTISHNAPPPIVSVLSAVS